MTAISRRGYLTVVSYGPILALVHYAHPPREWCPSGQGPHGSPSSRRGPFPGAYGSPGTPRSAGADAYPEVTMDGTPAEPQWRVMHIPEGMTVDGAVVELRLYPDGIVGVVPRIPGPAAP